MDKSNRVIGQVYAYFVCLVAVLLFLTSVKTIAGSAVDLGDIENAADLAGTSLESFERFRMQTLNALAGRKGAAGAAAPQDNAATVPAYVPGEPALRGMFAEEREARLRSARHAERRRIFESAFVGILCVPLFSFHWVWARRKPRPAG